MKTKKQSYVSLTLEVIEVQMEKGYAASADGNGSDVIGGGGW